MRIVRPKPLTPEAFAPYGEVISVRDEAEHYPINYGATTRYHALAHATAQDGGVILSIFRSTPLADLTLKIMERHPLGSQAFMPLNGRPYLVAVAPAGDLDLARIEVFLAGGDQGVNYAAGTWHHYSLALEAVSDFLVVDRQGPGANLDEIELAEADWIRVLLER
ncbi:ureidoglycolate lyase [Caulobacter sp. SLTY]|uniref:ureidoglycolate lyase n=1 Tax=Caulobacter sp. SLTY TaxID=2683262 RepID=UPI001412B582|nr:ureidoglycolate lyase [Caulobacter sp. SLTY]NBB14360.1 ureidoglycolate lyase [Caulobacter sp. SLTY]